MFLSRSLYPLSSWRGALYQADRLAQEMGRLLGGVTGQMEGSYATGVFPLVNVSEDKDNYYVRAELPGVDPAAIDISVLGKNLSLTGERQEPDVPENSRYHRRERGFASFNRVLTLPGGVDPEKVSAASSLGVLTVTLPKAEEMKPKQIAVQAD